MNKLPFPFLIAVLASAAFAQSDPRPRDPASEKYEAYRMEGTAPRYGLHKINALVAKIKRDSDDNEHMAQRVYDKLSFAEKFTYAMVHGEDASQNCDEMPALVDSQHKIFSYIPGAFNETEAWSERQLKFLHDNRSKVIVMLRKNIKERRRVGINFKQAIAEIQANELIPDVLAVYKRDHKDNDILTLCIQLMKAGNYKPFIASPTYKKLYGDAHNYQSYVQSTPANRKFIAAKATAFYRLRTK